MPDAKDLRSVSKDALRAHLEFYQELGVPGISRDPAWRTRPARAQVTPEEVPEEVSVEVEEMSPSPNPKLDVAAPAPVRPAEDLLAEVRAEIGDNCTRCKLCKLGRTQIVFGVGNPHAQLMFVGEAPGQDEDLQGEPFVGRAGQLLTKIIEAIGLSRGDVYIANVIKCRPPNNRNPEPDEVATCEPFLFRQIDAIKPKVIVALGTFAAQTLLKTRTPITRLRGVWTDYHGIPLMPTFHPAYLLRNPAEKRVVWQDIQEVMKRLGLPR
jgi:uracil-DNA glycosylase family 4